MLFNPAGLTFYGGLVCAGVAIAAALAVGLALKDSLSNFASGRRKWWKATSISCP